MEPTDQDSEIETTLTLIFGFNRKKSILENVCVMCKQPAIEFPDEISKQEFSISGLCFDCQDKVFGGRD